jgi:hypothetical protein
MVGSMRNILYSLFLVTVCGCGGSSGYSGQLVNGMNGESLNGVRIVARSSPPSTDLTCQVREVTSDESGGFAFSDLCRDQSYVLTVPTPNLHLSGTNTIASGESTEVAKHSAWRSPDGSGIFRLSEDKVQPIPTFADVARDKALDGSPVLYPDMKPTGRVITIAAGDHLIISGKNWVKRQQLKPLISDEKRQRLASGFITNHVYIGLKFDGGKVQRVDAELDSSKVTDVLIRGEGVRFIAHDALPEGRYALMAEDDQRVTILDFGASQAPAK